jgi:site-specific DNA-methyltransferase (adenine-specific)
MANKSHFNSGHMAINQLKKNGVLHSSTIIGISTLRTVHGVFIQDAVDFLKALPDSSVQLILIDPPYNLDLDKWDSFHNYLDWANHLTVSSHSLISSLMVSLSSRKSSLSIRPFSSKKV